MQDHQLHDQQPADHRSAALRRVPLGVIAGLSAVVVAAGGGTAWWTWNTITTAPTPDPVTEVDPATPATPSEVAPSETTTPEPQPGTAMVETAAQVFWVDVAGTEFELVPVPVQAESADDPEVVLTAAFETLLSGPNGTNAFSEIPEGTELLDVMVQSDGVHVDLSQEFEMGGGSASMMGRLGQVIYTASSLEPSEPVWLSIEGQPLEVLGGEGLLVDQPMTRSEFEENFPF